MATKKSRKGKKYNPKKTLNQVVKYSLRNWGILWVGTHDLKCYLGNLRTGKIARPNPAQASALLEQPFKWQVVNAVFCRDQNGQEYMQEETIVVNDPCLHTDLADFSTQKHQKVLDSANPNHKITVGWLACPIFDTESIPLDNIERVFRAKGAFDYLAAWEVKTNETRSAETC